MNNDFKKEAINSRSKKQTGEYMNMKKVETFDHPSLLPTPCGILHDCTKLL